MFVESVGSSVLVAKLRGGKITNLLDMIIHKWWLVLLAGSIEYVTSFIREREIEPLWTWVDQNVLWFQLLSYILLIWALIENRHSKGFKLILMGVMLNFIVITANGGRMPVDISGIDQTLFRESLETLKTGKNLTHSVLNETTKLGFLGDIIHLKKPYPMAKSLSIGDLFMMAGIFLFVQGQALYKNKVTLQQ